MVVLFFIELHHSDDKMGYRLNCPFGGAMLQIKKDV